MVLAVALVPLGDAISKLLAQSMHSFEVAMWRLSGQTLITGLVMLCLRQPFRPVHLRRLAFCGFLTAVMLAALIGAFTVMPIATAIAIFFVEPLLLTVISALILREPTGWRRFAAVGVGLVGTLIVIRPNFASFGPLALLPLLAALSFAGYAATIRSMSGAASALTMQFWITLFGALFMTAGVGGLAGMGLLQFAAPVLPPDTWLLIAAGAGLSAFTFLLFTEAFKRTPASTLAPFQYLEIVGATLAGYVIFGDFPDLLTWAGTAIILASGLYVFHRERQAGAPPPDPAIIRE